MNIYFRTCDCKLYIRYIHNYIKQEWAGKDLKEMNPSGRSVRLWGMQERRIFPLLFFLDSSNFLWWACLTSFLRTKNRKCTSKERIKTIILGRWFWICKLSPFQYDNPWGETSVPIFQESHWSSERSGHRKGNELVCRRLNQDTDCFLSFYRMDWGELVNKIIRFQEGTAYCTSRPQCFAFTLTDECVHVCACPRALVCV